MSADIVNKDVCLGVAIDHRLQKLCVKGSPLPSTMRSAHLDDIGQLGSVISRSGDPITQDEIDVTAGLAGPPQIGGVCFLLQQPAQHHPYHLGERLVSEYSPTLRAISEVWRVVTMGSGKPVILDRLPFIRPKDNTTATFHAKLQRRSMKILQEKQPDVILCMWQRRRGSKGAADEDVALFERFESLGIGRTFNLSDTELLPGVSVKRVNAFHPSYAVNYNPHLSCFRQLLILEVAQAWGRSKNQWVEQEWMGELRQDCSRVASILALRQRGTPIRYLRINAPSYS